jgi:hypothetical protein
MPIVSGDIQVRLSGGAGNSNPNASLGGAISSTALVDATLHNLFREINEDETAAGITLYRCFYFRNNHGSLTWKNVKQWVQTNTPSPDTTVAIAFGSSGVNSTEQTIVNETTAPTGVTFASPTDKAGGQTVGDVPSTHHFPVWVRLTVTAGAAAYDDSVVVRAGGGTAA